VPATIKTQRRELRRNYIGVVSHKFDEQCAGELQTKSDAAVKGYLLRLMAVIRSRRARAE
jgi:hypothetical protein